MRFGIFYEHQRPRPWSEDGEHRLLQNAVEQVDLADRRVGDDRSTIAPSASGPQVRPVDRNRHRPLPRPRLTTLRKLAKAGGQQAFHAFVRRASDARLERTAGSDRGIRLVFAAIARAYEPDMAHGFTGELQYDLRRGDGRVVRWTVRVDPRRATARPGPAADPALTLKTTVADFLRIVAGDLEPGRALLTGRLDLAGEFSLAQRVGEMFGRPTAV